MQEALLTLVYLGGHGRRIRETATKYYIVMSTRPIITFDTESWQVNSKLVFYYV